MNAAGQVLLEFLLLALLFLTLIAGITKEIPITFSTATPILGAKIEDRLETGRGFSAFAGGSSWSDPLKPKGGMKDSP